MGCQNRPNLPASHQSFMPLLVLLQYPSLAPLTTMRCPITCPIIIPTPVSRTCTINVDRRLHKPAARTPLCTLLAPLCWIRHNLWSEPTGTSLHFSLLEPSVTSRLQTSSLASFAWTVGLKTTVFHRDLGMAVVLPGVHRQAFTALNPFILAIYLCTPRLRHDLHRQPP